MTTKTAARRNEAHRREVAAATRKAQQRRARNRRLVVGAAVAAVLVGVVAVMMATSRPTSSAATRAAPNFTLTDTAGHRVHLSDFRGKSNVVLYFSEGAGCAACIQQMGLIEKDKAAFDKANITVLPIVMNTRDQVLRDMNTFGVRTPFLLDDGAVSTAYNTIGHGMHAGLPGHSFVLIDKAGIQRWYGEYPSMYLSPADLLGQVEQHLGT